MDGMVFDAGTWWLITICVTALITLIGACLLYTSGFGFLAYTKEHDSVATFVMCVKTDEETAKKYIKNEGMTAQDEVQKAE